VPQPPLGGAPRGERTGCARVRRRKGCAGGRLVSYSAPHEQKDISGTQPNRMKMPPPGQSPPNGNGSSPHNGRADEPSAEERITRLEVLAQSAVTKTDFANLKAEMAELRAEMKTEMAELRADMAEFKGEVKAEMAKLNGRMDALDQKIESGIASLRSEMKAEMAALRAEMHAGFVTTLRWTIGVMLGVIVPFFSAVLAILKFL